MSASVVVDTNVLSELARPAPDRSVVRWFEGLSSAATSAVVVYELARGIELMSRGKRKAFLEQWFAELLEVVEVLPVGRDVALAAAQLEVSAKARGHSIEVRDLLIAATAQTTSALLVTRKTSDFSGLGISLYDPFSGTRTR